MGVSMRRRSATQREMPSLWPKVFGSRATGTMTCCNNLLPFWRTSSQSSPKTIDNPSPVAELRSAPPSPARGEGKKDRHRPSMTASRIHRLTLTHFRNYRAASLEARGDVVVLVGPNGAGKTNCIEAISFLSPGRGLRRATLDDVSDNQGDGSWAVSAEVEGALGLATLGTGIEAPRAEATAGRRYRIDRESVSSATALGDHLRMVW